MSVAEMFWKSGSVKLTSRKVDKVNPYYKQQCIKGML